MAAKSNEPEFSDDEAQDEDASDFPGHEALARRHLQLLVESSAATEPDFATQPDFSEQQMLLSFLINERRSALNRSSNASSGQQRRRRRLPFLHSRRFAAGGDGQQSEAAPTDDFRDGGESFDAATAEMLEARFAAAASIGAEGRADQDDDEARHGEGETRLLTEADASANQSAFEQPEQRATPPTSRLRSANQSNAQLDMESDLENEGERSISPMEEVFSKETAAVHGGGPRNSRMRSKSRASNMQELGSMVSDGIGQSSKQLESNQPAPASNLMVWHRFSEIPFDISSSEFTVKTPVLPLVQGGHLVFLMSKCSQRTYHYSVKIIKKANSSFGSGARTKRRQSITNQTAVINKDEFLVLKKMAHPFVAMLLYFCENQSLYYYFFPQYSLANLSSNASMYMRIDAKACVYVTCCIINAVEYLYRNCIVHRDISSKCVLFNADFKPVLFHFDYATFYGTMRSAEARLTFLPEMSSRAPEVISADICKLCEPEHYVNCDIWGVGVLLGELLLNSLVMMRALKRKLDLHWVFSVREGGPEDTSGMARSHPVVPRDLMELLRMCLRKYPQDRPNIYALMQNQVFYKYDVSNVHTIHCKPSPLISDFHRLL